MNKRTIISICLSGLVFLLVGTAKLSAQTVVIKNNLLYDAVAWTPNLALEVAVSPRWTVGLSAGYNPFPLHDSERKWKHVLLTPQARYWFCSKFAGHFIGTNFSYAHYNVGGVTMPFGMIKRLRDERYQGDLVGLGINYGYSWILSRRWSIEADLGLGYGYAWYKRYNCIKCGSYKGTDAHHHLMLSKLGISIVYNIK